LSGGDTRTRHQNQPRRHDGTKEASNVDTIHVLPKATRFSTVPNATQARHINSTTVNA
jgi:hypothetical protein